MENLITVLMGVYNCADTVGEALDSLLNQTIDCWKCVICDDGSTDDTYAIIKEYEKSFPDKFTVIKIDENMGLNIALNKCLQYADTPYIARMDGDDISLENRFEVELDFLENNHDFDIVSSSMVWFDENGDYRFGKLKREVPTLRDVIISNYICHAPAMIRTCRMKDIEGYSDDKKATRVEDVDLWIRLYFAGAKCFNISEPLYRVREDRNFVNRVELKYRLNAALIRLAAAKKAKLNLFERLRCFSKVIVGLLPNSLYQILHRLNK